MQIESVRLTEIRVDEGTTIRVASDIRQKSEVPIKARLSFLKSDGTESGIDIMIRAWKITGKGSFTLNIISGVDT